MELKLIFKGNIPSGNVFDRFHWAKKAKTINGWHWLVKQALQKTKINFIGNTSYFKVKIKCSVTKFYAGQSKIIDNANLMHSLDKLVIDNLVKEKILVDDSPVFFEWGRIMQKRGLENYIILTLEEVND